MGTKVAIRTSDRNQFRRCRLAWHYGSPLRMGKKRIAGIETRHLDFGSAIHLALEIYYDFARQPSSDATEEDKAFIDVVLRAEAIQAFNDYMLEWQNDLINNQKYHPAAEEEWNGLVRLGNGMLNGYFDWASLEYSDYEIAYSEVEFEVPIAVPDDIAIKLNERNYITQTVGADLGSELKKDEHYKEFWPALKDDTYYLLVWNNETKRFDLVTYQGRIDVILRHKSSGRYWIVDHKTAAKFDDITDWIDIDPQGSAYFLAVKKILGVDVEGVIFNYLRKAVPDEPKVLKSGKFSMDKSQNTTKKLYIQALKREGLSTEPYMDFLRSFEEPKFFKSQVTYRTDDELKYIEYCIATEAIDMLNDPSIYPNPNQINCRGCAYKQPCQMRHEDNDDIWFLEESGAYVYNSEREIK